MRVTIGCCGFPVARSRYHESFGLVELDSPFYHPPTLATARRWRQEAPRGFQFTLKAWQLITHPPSSPTYRKLGRERPARLDRCGGFRPTPEVDLAWDRTRQLAQTLKARVILFQTPASFAPGADSLRDMYAFFRKKRARPQALLAWEPRGPAWTEKLVAKVCSDLGLVHATDPLRHAATGRVCYYRLHGAYQGERIVFRHRYDDSELARLAALCRERPAFVLFNNSEMFEDALRFSALAGKRPAAQRP